MNKKFFISFILIAVFTTICAVSNHAQTNLIGTYSHNQKIDEGRNTLDLIFELKAKNAAVYRNEQDGVETQKRFGTWTWNKKTKLITIIMPPVKNPTQGQEVKLTFVFRVVGTDLKLIKDLPYNDGIGNIYQKQN